ncbi:histidine kinase N-terminal 7TM domain-containing protein [Haloplanus salilacus]|uniref:histidine kinase N-terminal 7TM domain-containing protein n=1 Tax=Haloplanus salilacus TaxID=2949994 RepID=UPI0030CCB411
MITILNTAFVALFSVAAGGCFWSAHRIQSFETSLIRRPLTVFLVTTGLWALATVPLLLPVSEAVMYASYVFGLVVGISTVVVWLWFCSAYAGHSYHLDTRLQLAAVGFVSSVVTLKLTDPFHRAYFEPAVSAEPFVHFAPSVGLLYWLVTTLAYVAAGVGLYLLFERYHRSNYGTVRLSLLTAAIGLPAVPQLVVAWRPNSIPLLYYEPVGAAIFAVGVVTVAREEFFAVHTPASRQLLDRLPGLILVTDRNDRIVDYNHSAMEPVSALSERVGDPFSDVFPELADADGTTVELPLETGIRTYQVDREPVSVGAETVGYTVILSDVTDLEEQRRRLQRQTEHIQDVTEAIAHEMRNPLAILIGNLERLGTEGGPSDADGSADRADTLRTVIIAAERINVVTDDLIAILRYGTPITEMEPLRLRPLLESARGDAVPECDLTVESGSGTEVLGERT